MSVPVIVMASVTLLMLAGGMPAASVPVRNSLWWKMLKLTETLGTMKIYKDSGGPQLFPGPAIAKTKQLVSLVAYDLWEQAGKPDGCSDQFWYEAEKTVFDAGYDLGSEWLMSRGYIFCPHPPA